MATVEGEPAYAVELDAEEARRLTDAGSSILLLDVPTGTSFGIDQQMFVVGPKFSGIKMVPPGPHFIYYASASSHGPDVAPLIGFFVFSSPSEIIVRQWDSDEECLVRCKDEDQEGRFVASVKKYEFDSRLGAYDLPHFHIWRHLSFYITKDVIDKHEPVGGNISIIGEADVSEKSYTMSAAEKLLKEQLQSGRRRDLEINNLSVQSSSSPSFSSSISPNSNAVKHCAENDTAMTDVKREGESTNETKNIKNTVRFGHCFYTDFKLFMKQKGLTPQELTHLNLDKSDILENIIHKSYQGNENCMLGEFQFCFIAFLMGQSIASFLQWKKFIILLCSCYKAPILSRTKLFTKWLDALYWQLKLSLDSQSNADRSWNNYSSLCGMLDSDWITQNNFMFPLFKDWFDSVFESNSIDSDLLNQCRQLRMFLESKFGWNFNFRTQQYQEDEDDDEYAPVVVELDESQHGQIF